MYLEGHQPQIDWSVVYPLIPVALRIDVQIGVQSLLYTVYQ